MVRVAGKLELPVITCVEFTPLARPLLTNEVASAARLLRDLIQPPDFTMMQVKYQNNECYLCSFKLIERVDLLNHLEEGKV